MTALLPFLLIAPGNQTVRATGKPLLEVRKISAVTAVEAGTAMTVEIHAGAPRLTIEAQKQVLPMVKTRVSGDKVTIMTEGSMNTDYPTKVRLWLPAVQSIKAIGATKVEVANLAGRTIDLDLSGASTIQAKGRAENLKLSLEGASKANLNDLAATNVYVSASGASQAVIRAVGRLKANASGASKISYLGHPKKVEREVSGVSSVTSG